MRDGGWRTRDKGRAAGEKKEGVESEEAKMKIEERGSREGNGRKTEAAQK